MSHFILRIISATTIISICLAGGDAKAQSSTSCDDDCVRARIVDKGVFCNRDGRIVRAYDGAVLPGEGSSDTTCTAMAKQTSKSGDLLCTRSLGGDYMVTSISLNKVFGDGHSFDTCQYLVSKSSKGAFCSRTRGDYNVYLIHNGNLVPRTNASLDFCVNLIK